MAMQTLLPDPDWLPLVNTPSHPEYPAGHPGQNGAAATVLLSYFRTRTDFTLTTAGQPSRTYTSISKRGRMVTTPASGVACTTRAQSRSATHVGQAIAKYVDQNSMQRLHPDRRK